MGDMMCFQSLRVKNEVKKNTLTSLNKKWGKPMKRKLTLSEQATQDEIDKAYADMLFWLLLIKARALDALQKGETDV